MPVDRGQEEAVKNQYGPDNYYLMGEINHLGAVAGVCLDIATDGATGMVIQKLEEMKGDAAKGAVWLAHKLAQGKKFHKFGKCENIFYERPFLPFNKKKIETNRSTLLYMVVK
jgi:hypothetical protein